VVSWASGSVRLRWFHPRPMSSEVDLHGERSPKSIRGPFGARETDQKLIVAGVRHYLIRDHTGLEGLDVFAMGTRRLSEARSYPPKVPGSSWLDARSDRLSPRQAWFTGSLAPATPVVNPSAAKRDIESTTNRRFIARLLIVMARASDPPPVRRRHCPPSLPGWLTAPPAALLAPSRALACRQGHSARSRSRSAYPHDLEHCLVALTLVG